ncbi:pyruvate dehydrogenase E1 component subunit beta-3, chloroplastic-like protein [Tanacetum coccineum]
MRYHVMQAVKTLVNKGYDPEVIDIRSLKPFDLHTIGNSIKKTHRVLIVEECMRTGGIGASLTAAINENFQDYLDTPIACLSSQDVPTPYAGTLEEWTVVQPPQIVAAVEQILSVNFVELNVRYGVEFVFSFTSVSPLIFIVSKLESVTSEESFQAKEAASKAREEHSINTQESDTHAYRMEHIQAMLHKTQVATQKCEKDLARTFIHQVLLK